MNWLEQVLSPALVRALGWTLVHSLWQGAVVALALAGLLLLLRRHRASVRYNVSAVALVVMLGLAAVTFARHYYAARTVVASATISEVDTIAGSTLELAAAPAATAPAGPLQAWLNYFDQNLPILVAVWLLGLLAMTLRLLGGLAYVQRLRHYRVQPLAEEWQQRLASIAARAGLERPVALLESALVKAPLVVGHLRPVILLPLGTATGLSQTYLEAILAHELAHVARRDYLMNLLQAIAETLFFYHPAVWFLSACLRTERENCCDDDATALVGGNPLTLARALAALAERSLEPQVAPRLAMSAMGPSGSLLGRIRRLVQGRGTPTFTEGFMAACVVLAGMVLLSTAVALADPQPAAEPTSMEGSLQRLPFLTEEDTTRKTSTATAAAQAAPETVPAVPLLPKSPVVVEEETAVVAPLADDDKKRKAKNSRTERVVIVNQNGPRRGGPGTVVIEKDKKGRLTDLYVNGRRVEEATADSKKKGKKTETRTEVIRVAPDSWSRGADAGSFNFGDDFARSFRFEGAPGLSKQDVERIRRDVRVQVDAARRQSNRNYNFEFRNEGGGRESYGDIERRALEQAEQGLREAERNAKTEVERTHIREERERVTERRMELRERMEDSRRDAEEARQEAMRDAEEARRDMEEAHRDMEAAHRDMEVAHRDASAARREAAKSGVVREALVAEMLRDKLITDRRNFTFSLRSNSLTVNGKKQPAAVLNKYLKLYEQRKGQKLSSTGGFTVNESSSSNTSMSSSDMPPPPPPPGAPAPMPPRPPRAPRAPLALPAPPAPPRVDSGRIREELRKDGLIGKDVKSFQFQLNDSGLRVNGQPQSAEMTEKYRKLLDVPASTNGSKTNRNIQISVSE
ncbi:M56 family metallopeptidase [Hymenobacter sediminicola]|uniref:M48 family metalloprotease n=1 Tax=Hymenobacter sediminicola TaxID=2761579 RepID=A0A7G7W9Y3_9BACT|nr:M56 family metallopeptidase [Hymenobacter sediminicola]QNH63176.1 M48 family metalloprotease [Hymenobacter sediminicola]